MKIHKGGIRCSECGALKLTEDRSGRETWVLYGRLINATCPGTGRVKMPVGQV